MHLFNDTPIQREDDDAYGIAPFAKSVASAIKSIKEPLGTTLAIHGPWGSGKSSAVNLIRKELETDGDGNLIISDFKCWWYRGEDALILAFLQHLNVLLTSSLSEKVKDLVPELARSLLEAAPVIGSALSLTPVGPVSLVMSPAAQFVKQHFPDSDPIDKSFLKLSKMLREQNKRFLIVIDDIDRLTPEEALAIFRIVKSVGSLPRVTYLLVFDRKLADETVAQRYPSEGPHFLEKIIQAHFVLPAPLQSDINRVALSAIQEICGSLQDAHLQRFLNVFYDLVSPHLTTPRHVVRLRNALSTTWPAIAGEVNTSDFLALETLRLYEPLLFEAIRSSGSQLCWSDEAIANEEHSADPFEPYLSKIAEESHEKARLALGRLFPRLQNVTYDSDSQAEWDADRLVCIQSHFDTYFRCSLSDETLSLEKINQLIEQADNPEFIQRALRDAGTVLRTSGATTIPIVLDELNSHARRIPKDKIGAFICALFEIHDEIDLKIDDDRGMWAVGDTTRRYHWLIRRLTSERFTLDERTALYLSALQSASLGWLVEFVSSARNEHREGQERIREEDRLVRQDAVDTLVERALDAIRVSAADNSLLDHQDLIYILWRWRDFLNDDPVEVRAWTDPLLECDEALVVFAKRFTGESLSIGMDIAGMGDRIPQRSILVRIDENTDIVDRAKLRDRLLTLQASGRLNEVAQKTVDDFLDAWHDIETNDIR